MDKQIEELSEELLFYTIIPNDELCDEVAEYIITAGYRKQEDVAREIFAEFETAMENLEFNATYRHTHVPLETMVEVANWMLHEVVTQRIAELKEKYGVTEE